MIVIIMHDLNSDKCRERERETRTESMERERRDREIRRCST